MQTVLHLSTYILVSKVTGGRQAAIHKQKRDLFAPFIIMAASSAYRNASWIWALYLSTVYLSNVLRIALYANPPFMLYIASEYNLVFKWFLLIPKEKKKFTRVPPPLLPQVTGVFVVVEKWRGGGLEKYLLTMFPFPPQVFRCLPGD